MDLTDYLDASPLDLIKYSEHSAMDAVAFIGTARKHPYDAEKCLLLASKQDNEKWLQEGTIIEFRLDDIVGADELPALVDEQGYARQLVRLWIRRGAIGVKYEPFEAGKQPSDYEDSEQLRRKFERFYHSSRKTSKV